MRNLFTQLSTAELDALWEKLLSGGHKLERHTEYVYNRVPEDYTASLQTWRENNELRRDVLHDMDRSWR